MGTTQSSSHEMLYKIEFTKDKELGQGQYGIVYKIGIKNSKPKQYCAGKFFKLKY